MPNALQLDLPGAPNTWHTIPGLNGFYHPDLPTPVGGDGQVSEEEAKELSDNENMPLKLVSVSDVDAAQADYQDQVDDARNAVREARNHAVGGEAHSVARETEALKAPRPKPESSEEDNE